MKNDRVIELLAQRNTAKRWSALWKELAKRYKMRYRVRGIDYACYRVAAEAQEEEYEKLQSAFDALTRALQDERRKYQGIIDRLVDELAQEKGRENV